MEEYNQLGSANTIASKPLIDMLESESYLNLCPNASVRELYNACLTQCTRLYGRYMDAVR